MKNISLCKIFSDYSSLSPTSVDFCGLRAVHGIVFGAVADAFLNPTFSGL